MNILITGAAGNIGKGMIPRLREAGQDLSNWSESIESISPAAPSW
jgi:NADP-dependent 3-hydroxy acid dehydrogenase YdfG